MLYGGFYGRSTLGGTFPGSFSSVIRTAARKVVVLLRTLGSRINLTTRRDRTVL